MRPRSIIARVVLFLALVALLLAAFTHPELAQPLAILAPLWLLLANIASPPARRPDEFSALPPAPVSPLFSPRPPPQQ